MRLSVRFSAFLLFVAIGAATQSAQAAKLTVNCDKHEPIRTALLLLATTNPQGPNTITVTGSCKGNIVIRSMDRLTLVTNKRCLDHRSLQRGLGSRRYRGFRAA